MAQPRIEDDIKFLWGEIKLGLNFLRGYFKDKAEEDAKKRKFAIIEYGPFNGAKLFGVVILTIVIFFTFSLWRFESTLWATLIIGILFYDIALQKEWIYPVLLDIGKIMYEIIKEIFIIIFEMITGFFKGIFEMIKPQKAS